jgi:hypothetical protein
MKYLARMIHDDSLRNRCETAHGAVHTRTIHRGSEGRARWRRLVVAAYWRVQLKLRESCGLVRVSVQGMFHSFWREKYRDEEDGCGEKDDRRSRRHIPGGRDHHSSYGRGDADDDGIQGERHEAGGELIGR